MQMGKPIEITRLEFSANELRELAAGMHDGAVVRRLLAIALILDGHSRAEAARLNGMDRQTLRDWVHRYNDEGVGGLSSRLSLPCVRAVAARIGSEPLGARIASSGSVRTGIQGQDSGAAAAAGEFGGRGCLARGWCEHGDVGALAGGALANGPGGGSQRWTAAARLQAVIATAAM